jgi:TonB family protein
VRAVTTIRLIASILAAGCAGRTPAPAAMPEAAPPVAAKPMPPIPDLSRMRTFRRPIPGVPTQSTGLTQPVLQRLGELTYPPRAWDQGLQGWAVYDFVVGANGRVDPRYVRLVAVSDSMFVRPAGDAVRGARFTPGSRAGTPVPMLVRLPVTFTIEPDTRRAPASPR